MKYKIYFTLLFLALYSSAFSQTGPGGVGSTTTNPLWLDVDQLSGYSNGAFVTEITDFSGNGNHAAQGTANRRGTYRTNGTNSRASVVFDGGNDSYETGAISALNTNTLTWYIIGMTNSNTATQDFITSNYTSGTSAAPDRLWGTQVSSGTNSFRTYTRSINSSKILDLGYNNGFQVLTSVWNGSTAFTGYRNGIVQGTTTGATATPTGHIKTRIGASSATFTNHLNGEVAEIITFNTILNNTQNKILNNYLSVKYNISLPNVTYSFSSTHSGELAGIGRQTATDMHTDAKGSGMVRINNADDLNDNEYLMWAHNEASINPLNQTDVPSEYTINSGGRYERVWRAFETGEVGNTSLSFYVGDAGFSDPNTYELLIDNDGTFGDGNATQHITGRSYDLVNRIVTFTNVNLSNGQYFTLGNSKAIISITSGSWGTASTWNCNCIPETGYFTMIDNGHTVTIDAAAFAGTLLIRPSGILTVNNSSTLTLSRNFDNTGTFNAGTGNVIFSSSANAQTILATTATTFFDLTLNNLSSDPNVNIVGGTFSVSRTLTLQSGNLNTNGNGFTLLSTSTQTARIAPIPTGSSISGTMVVQRYMSGRVANWHDMSSPVQNSTVSDWDTKPNGTNEIYMSGVNGPDGKACCPDFYSVQTYDEPTASYVNVTSGAEPLTPMKGFMIWLADNMSTWSAKAWDTRGVPNQGNQSFPVTLTSGSGDGWNLVGNPYASFVSWDTIRAASTWIDDNVNVLNNGTYESHPLNQGFQIPPGQGFWVYNYRSNGTYRIRESAKTDNPGSTFYKTVPKQFNLTIRSNINEFSNITKIALNENAAEEFDQFDGRFRNSPYDDAPAITTLSSDTSIDLSYNSLNTSNDYVIIPVKSKVGVSGEYTIDFTGLNNVSEQYPCVLFEDTKTGDIIDLKDKSSYSFDASAEENNTRFKIHMMKSYNKCEAIVADVASPVKNDEIVITKNYVEFNMIKTTDAKISVYNMLGQKMMEDISVRATSDRIYLNTSHLNGIHFVVVETAESRVSEKINFMNF